MIDGTFIVVAVDVGSTRAGNFGWVRVDAGSEPLIASSGTDIDACVAELAAVLDSGLPVALGIEAPGWLPVPENAAGVGCGRDGDGNRSCFAPAGGYVAALGMAQAAWIIRALAAHRGSPVEATHLEAWRPGKLLLWEAFVSGAAHASKADDAPHVRAAATAAMELVHHFRARRASAVRCRAGDQVLSLFGSVLVWGRVAGHVIADDAEIVAEPSWSGPRRSSKAPWPRRRRCGRPSSPRETCSSFFPSDSGTPTERPTSARRPFVSTDRTDLVEGVVILLAEPSAGAKRYHG